MSKAQTAGLGTMNADSIGVQQRVAMLDNAKKYIKAGQIKGTIANQLSLQRGMDMTNVRMVNESKVPKMTNMEYRQLLKVYKKTKDPALGRVLGQN